jgi:hypothetical protein
MCFSAGASFIAGTVLISIGIASVSKVNKKSNYLFASIPIIFGFQQLTEGIIWMSLYNAENRYSLKVASYLFLFIAQVIWPTWVPLSILLLDKKNLRKNIQKLLVILGAALSIYLVYCLYCFHIDAKIVGHHIAYFQAYPVNTKGYVLVAYGLVTILPALVSQIKSMWLLGLCLLLSYLVTAIFYEAFTLSVWCFFAAIISAYVYLIILRIRTPQANREMRRFVDA